MTADSNEGKHHMHSLGLLCHVLRIQIQARCPTPSFLLLPLFLLLLLLPLLPLLPDVLYHYLAHHQTTSTLPRPYSRSCAPSILFSSFTATPDRELSLSSCPQPRRKPLTSKQTAQCPTPSNQTTIPQRSMEPPPPNLTRAHLLTSPFHT